MHLVAIGGSDAGISTALRARELDPSVDVTVVVADAYPNFSICGIPYYFSREVQPWQSLAHRTHADLEATGMNLRLDTLATSIDVDSRRLTVRDADGTESTIPYDELMVGTGAAPSTAGISGLDQLGPDDGVHLLHSMGDTFALEKYLDEHQPATAIIVGAGYVGLEMAEALTVRGLQVTQLQRGPEVLSTSIPNSVPSYTTDSPATASTSSPIRASKLSHATQDESLLQEPETVTRSPAPLTWCSSSSAYGPTPAFSPQPVQPRARAALWSSTIGCAPACRTFGRPATEWSLITASSVSRISRSARPPTSKAASRARTRSAATRSSPGASARRS